MHSSNQGGQQINFHPRQGSPPSNARSNTNSQGVQLLNKQSSKQSNSKIAKSNGDSINILALSSNANTNSQPNTHKAQNAFSEAVKATEEPEAVEERTKGENFSFKLTH